MKPNLRLALPGLLAIAACASGSASKELFPVDRAHRFSRKSSANTARSARLFEEGLLLCYAFHHEAASERFAEAVKIDPDFAMAHWGLAYAAGPHINNMAMTPETNARAVREAKAAKQFEGSALPVERALIDAIQTRYVDPLPADRQSLDKAYADAMAAVHKAFPNDDDVAVLYAEALMDLRPWDLYDKDGNPRPDTPKILELLDLTLSRNPNHPQANHLMIHSAEASTRPERALPAADRLRDMIPEAGHLVHMPAHIDIRLGRYPQAIQANANGIRADKESVKYTGPGGFHAMYRAHNYHFLVYAAMFDGQSKLALSTAREMVSVMPPELVASLPDVLDGFLATPYHVLDRFGMWDVMLSEPRPDPRFPVTTAFWHFSRGLAFAATGKLDEALAEENRLGLEYFRVPTTATIGTNSARTVLDIGRELLRGEIEFRQGKTDSAFFHLREAVKLDNALAYDEPWSWMVPPSHALGALLLESGAADEPEEVYRQDLKRHRNNGWALHGLAEALQRKGNTQGANEARAAFEKAWARADVKIPGSCFCRRVASP
jgi:tetratricopeptide (TPR) repeat protein